MIRVIQGTFGFNNGTRTVPITSASGSVDLGNPALEARLVKSGVAVYAEGSTATNNATTGADPNADQKPTYDKNMKLADLQKIALAYGVDASKMRTKDDVIAAIDAAIAATNDEDETPPEDDQDDDTPPNPGTADPEGAMA